jgi:hypothetical protein
MSIKDRCRSLAPYFKVHKGKLTAFRLANANSGQ